MLTINAAIATLSPVAPQLVDVAQSGWAGYVAEGIPRRNRTTRANIVSDHMHARAANVLGAHRARAARSDKPFYVVGDITLRFKYLKRGRAANVLTLTQMALDAQRPLPERNWPPERPTQLALDGLAGPKAKPPYVTIGYELDSAETAVARVLAVYDPPDHPGWMLDVGDMVAFGPIDLSQLTISAIGPNHLSPLGIQPKRATHERPADAENK